MGRAGAAPAPVGAAGVTGDPEGDTRLTAWEMVHHLARTLELRSRQRPAEALAYNGLVQSYPETGAFPISRSSV